MRKFVFFRMIFQVYEDVPVKAVAFRLSPRGGLLQPIGFAVAIVVGKAVG